jgi:hypothetical protein
MVPALDAIVLALAPAFAAGFAIQKLLEIFDWGFSCLADWLARLFDKNLEREPAGKVSKGVTDLFNWGLGPFNGYLSSREIAKTTPELDAAKQKKTEADAKLNAAKQKKTEAENSLKTAEGDEQKRADANSNLKKVEEDVKNAEGEAKNAEEERKKAEEKVEGEKKEFVKGIKVLLTGFAAIGIAFWIVSNSEISVIKPLLSMMNNSTTMSINLTTNASINATASANKPFYISPSVDYWITVLFIAAGTDGVNSILKYLGYAKEEKKETASVDKE